MGMATSTAVVNSALAYVTAFAFLLFFAIVFLLVYFAVRFRRSRNPKPTEIPGNTLLEVLWITMGTLLVLTMFFYGLTGFRFLRRVPAGSLHVKVVSRQWSWLFEYDNGLKATDLVAPVGKKVQVELTSQDVIHSFFVPAFRIKQDAVPGMRTQAWFQATQAGTFDILCAEYCGQRHSAMRARLIVVSPGEFADWYAGRPVQIADLRPGTSEPKGEELLLHKGCLSCHSQDGTPLVGPTFKGLLGRTEVVISDSERHTIIVDESYIRRSILDSHADLVAGYQDVMPEEKGLLTDAEIEEIIKYLEQLK
jgi:cytochrome c oxidase subunit 2